MERGVEVGMGAPRRRQVKISILRVRKCVVYGNLCSNDHEGICRKWPDKTGSIHRILRSFSSGKGRGRCYREGECPPAAPGRNLGFEVAKSRYLWAPN